MPPQVQKPLIQFEDYFKTPAISFRILGLNPYFECKIRTTTLRKWFNFFLFHVCFWVLVLSTILELIFVITIAGDKAQIMEFVRALSCILFDVMGIEELLLIWLNGQKFNEFILQLEEVFPKDRKTQEKYAIHKHAKDTKLLLKNLTTVFMVCIFIWMAGSPVYDVVVSAIYDTPYVFELPFKMWSPVDLDQPLAFNIALLMQFDTIYASVLIILAVNTFMVSIVSQISLQFDMLAQNFRELPPNDTQGVIKLITTHIRLIEICKKFAELVSRTVFIVHFLSSLAICCGLFQMLQTDTSEIFRFLIFLICVLIQTFNVSYIGDVLIQHVSD